MVVGVSGGIAAYKACELVRWLKTRDASVIVVMTRAATEFVTPLTFQTLSGNPVVKDLWGDQAPGFALPPAGARKLGGKVEHVDVAEAADAVVIAPATADLMARIVHGEAPDALTSMVLASRAPLIVCPSMDLEMWRNPATQANVAALLGRGAVVVGPDTGPLASGLEGPGRLAAIETIGQAVREALERRTGLQGLRVLVGAGRTEEAIDPVRVLTNRSSGRMGYALAEACRDRGAEVTLVTGPASVAPPARVRCVPVTAAAEMERAMLAVSASADMVLMAAAVADYRPARYARGKLTRSRRPMTLELEPNPDILARLAARRKPGQVFVGFALETSGGVARARAKLNAKQVDLIVLNTPEESLGRETNRVTLVEARSARRLPRLAKRQVAEAILDRVLELRAARVRRAARVQRVTGLRRTTALRRAAGGGRSATAGPRSAGARRGSRPAPRRK